LGVRESSGETVFAFLDSLRDRFDPLVRLARSGQTVRFMLALLRAELTVLSLPESLSIDLEDLPPDSPELPGRLLAMVEAAARDMSEDKPIRPFTLNHGEVQCLPFFSSPRAAESFAKGYVQKVRRILPFQLYTAPGHHVLPTIATYDRVVLNLGTAASYELSSDDLHILRSALASDTESQRLWPDA
jgi:hypothetical protein